ncbi:MAG TPA: Hsp70 family protein [Burkholderiales bacterium]|nr:Hsp70 family protein [Burkholderiales bacterium]
MFIGIDFGTSNSAVAAADGALVSLVPLENGEASMPTALFFNAEEHRTAFGRQAIREYTEGIEGRLLRSIKSVLGGPLMEEKTLVAGRATGFDEIIAFYLGHLRRLAQAHLGHELTQVIIGRPVHFVDDDAKRDAAAQAALKRAGISAGFREVAFQFEPIAAALDYELGLAEEEVVLVVDIGGGTSDFSVIRLGPARSKQAERKDDILASGGVHLGGTDFDRQLSLATAMPPLGYGSAAKGGRIVPASIYFDLATWHKINFLYSNKEMYAAEQLRFYYEDAALHARLMEVLKQRLGHQIAGRVEAVKIAVADGGQAALNLEMVEAGLSVAVQEGTLHSAIDEDVERIVDTAQETLKAAGIAPESPLTLYFTGGSTGVRQLREAFHTRFARAKMVNGDMFGSVARGLGVHAARVFGGEKKKQKKR